MTYVMSDIHGDSARFHAMLDLIGFSADDTLYILGDVIDRGADGISLLQEIMSAPNMVLLPGNHEDLMLQTIETGSALYYTSWMSNGGGQTLAQYFQLCHKDRYTLKSWLRGLPAALEIEVKGRKFRLVHAFGADPYSCLWGRPHSLDAQADWIDDQTQLIIGHTPVLLLLTKTEEEQDAYVRRLMQQNDHFRILHAPGGFIDLDCGCGHPLPVSRLACLRLEDMQEFYT